MENRKETIIITIAMYIFFLYITKIRIVSTRITRVSSTPCQVQAEHPHPQLLRGADEAGRGAGPAALREHPHQREAEGDGARGLELREGAVVLSGGAKRSPLKLFRRTHTYICVVRSIHFAIATIVYVYVYVYAHVYAYVHVYVYVYVHVYVYCICISYDDHCSVFPDSHHNRHETHGS